LPKAFGVIPAGAIAAIANVIHIIKTLGIKAISSFAQVFGDSIAKGLGQTTNQA
jgi:hypothetical protein